MSDKANRLAEKLLSEGDRTLAFFRLLPDKDWDKQVYADNAHWTVRDMVEHLALSEKTLVRLFAQVAAGGPGASPDFEIDRFNREHTGRLASLSREELCNDYAAGRQNTAGFARGLNDEQLAMRGRHPAMGDSSVEDMLKLVYLHNTVHVKDVKRALAAHDS